MKKFILSAVAAGALAVGGAASAQDLGTVLGTILGAGTQTHPIYSGPTVINDAPPGTVYIDEHGRRVAVDSFGRHVLVPNVQSGTTYGITGYDAWGRPVYGTIGSGYWNRRLDRDGDGVANAQDRWPDNRFAW